MTTDRKGLIARVRRALPRRWRASLATLFVAFRGSTGWMVPVLLAGSGCAGPSGKAPRVLGTGARPSATDPSIVARGGISPPATAEAISVSTWATRALEGAREEEVLEGIRGHEREYFLEVLQRVAKETREVGAVVRGAARCLSERGGTGGAVVVVRELWARECCMRRGFLAEGLRGVVEGLEARFAEPVREAGTALSLEEFSGHADPDVAAAARAAGLYFTVESSLP